MNIILRIVLLCLCALSFIYTESDNFEFTTPDIVVETRLDGAKIRLEAFKTTLNDLIIRNKSVNDYSRLHWVSIGVPRLVETATTQNGSAKLFSWSGTGFYTLIDTLSDSHRELIVDKIKKQYNINITTDQILSLITEHFDCKIRLECPASNQRGQQPLVIENLFLIKTMYSNLN